MTRIRPRTAALLAASALATAAVAGCGSSSNDSGSSGSDMGGMSTSTSSGGMTTTAHSGHTMSGQTSGSAHMQGMTPLVSGADGTSATAAGLTLKPASTAFAAGKSATYTFKVLDAKGMAVTTFERDQTKLMHLIVVRDDFTGYQHLHPSLAADGTFTVPLTLAQAGSYHAISDFTTGGKRYALAEILTAPGAVSRVALPAPSPMTVSDGYEVRLARGTVMAGKEAQLSFTVTQAGKPVTALQPYLGAYGHLVALRKPDLAYSHVHPTAEDLKAGSITFSADFAAAGTYRLFLQFRTGGSVHTALFTVNVAG